TIHAQGDVLDGARVVAVRYEVRVRETDVWREPETRTLSALKLGLIAKRLVDLGIQAPKGRLSGLYVREEVTIRSQVDAIRVAQRRVRVLAAPYGIFSKSEAVGFGAVRRWRRQRVPVSL